MTADKLTGILVKIEAASGADGRLYGSITSQHVADALKAQGGVDIDKRKITVDAVKNVGETTALIKLYPEIAAKIKLNIVAKD